MIDKIPKILVVDDDKFFLEFYRVELSQYNLETEFATDGDQALVKAKSLKPDIILLDIILPKKDGFEVLTELKQDPATKNIPVIINSSLSEQSDRDKLTALGAIHFFNKLTNLPRDVALYIQESLKKGGFPEPQTTTPVSESTETKLSLDQVNSLFKESLEEIEISLQKLFHKKANLEDMNAIMIPYFKFEQHVEELSKSAGTIFIYSRIEAAVPGVAILSMKRNATLSLIKLIEQGMLGKELGSEMSDRVIEEFVNIILNAFLTKLSTSLSGKFLLTPSVITNSHTIKSVLSKSQIEANNLVVFLEQTYLIETLDLNFSLFVIFGSKLFEESKNDH